MRNKIFIIYPSTYSTNFEISRLNYWTDLKSEFIDIYPIPIDITNIFLDKDEFVLKKIKSNINLENHENITLVFIKSSLILIDQFKLVHRINKYAFSLKTILSLGDEYALSLEDIEVNQFLYDKIIVYNKEIFSNIDNSSGKFLFFPIIGKEPHDLNLLNKVRDEQIIFIGQAYKSRVNIAKRIIKKNKNLKFIFAGKGWTRSLNKQQNVDIFEWLNNENYTKFLLNSKYSLILDMDENGILHTTSKLPDAISHGCIPIFLDFDSRITNLEDKFVFKIQTLKNFGKIVKPYNLIKEELIIKEIKEKLLNSNNLVKFTDKFLEFIFSEVDNKKEKDLYHDLFHFNKFDLMNSKKDNFNFKYKNRNVFFNLRLFGLRLPRKVSLYIRLCFLRSKKESSKGYLFIETSGLLLNTKIFLIPFYCVNFILKKIYPWV